MKLVAPFRGDVIAARRYHLCYVFGARKRRRTREGKLDNGGFIGGIMCVCFVCILCLFV